MQRPRCSLWVLLPVTALLLINAIALWTSDAFDVPRFFRVYASTRQTVGVDMKHHGLTTRPTSVTTTEPTVLPSMTSANERNGSLPKTNATFVEVENKTVSVLFKDFMQRVISPPQETKDGFAFVDFVQKRKRQSVLPFERVSDTAKVLMMEENCSLLDLTFPTARKVPAREAVPKIVHLTWKSTAVPGIAVTWIDKWAVTNPDWQVWFWTDQAAESFMRKVFPDYTVFLKYKVGIQRADAMRYFILYKYGGLYADLDIEPLMSLNPLIEQYSCGLSQEPYEHSGLLRPNMGNKLNFLACNALMFCAPAHPYFKYVMDNLERHFKQSDTMYKTGPIMLSNMHMEYVEKFTRESCRNVSLRIGITPPEFFIPQFDRLWTGELKRMCGRGRNRLKLGQRNVCDDLKARAFRNEAVQNISFTTHHWFHTWTDRGRRTYFKKGVDFNSTHIHKIIPSAKLVSL